MLLLRLFRRITKAPLAKVPVVSVSLPVARAVPNLWFYFFLYFRSKDLMTSFKNFFMTEKEMKERDKKIKKEKSNVLNVLQNTTTPVPESLLQQVGDGDTCCPT